MKIGRGALFVMIYAVVIIIMASCVSSAGAPADDMPKENKTEMEINEAVRNYIEGWYDKDENRISKSIHPLLAKRSPDAASSNGIRHVDKAGLLGVVQQFGGDKGLGRTVDITVYETRDNLATVKAVSNEYVDYIHLAYTEGSWQIVNVLWEFRSARAVKPDDAAVRAMRKPALDYVEGWYQKDAERVKRGLHPDLAKRNLDENGGIGQYTRQSLLDIVPVYGGSGSEKKFEFTVLDAGKDIASVKVVSDAFTDYIHLIKWKGQWYVLNVLWCFN